MNQDSARRIVLSMEGACEGFHHGHPDFRVGKKIFATLWPDENRSVLMIGPALSESTAAEKGQGYKVVGGGKCLSVELDRIDEGEYLALAEIAWRTASTG